MSRACVINIHTIEDDAAVVTTQGADGQYRRQPCPGCPWKVVNTGTFPPGVFAHSANTAEDMSNRLFGCHESGVDRSIICAGFLLRGAEHNMAVRMLTAKGSIDLDQVSDGGHELHRGYVSMALANGVASADLSRCRLSCEEAPEVTQ